MRSSLRLRRLRSLLLPGTLLVLLLLALVPADGMLLGETSTLLVLLTAVIVAHYRLETHLTASRTMRPPALASPLAVAVALTIVVVIGSLVAIMLAVLISAVVKIGGDGRGLLRILLVAFALLPCLSIGARCGRWWAFSGSLLLVPAAGMCVLVAGPRSTHGLIEILFVAAATGLVVAVGSLQRRLNATLRSKRARTNEAASPAQASRSESEPPLAQLPWTQPDRSKRRAHG